MELKRSGLRIAIHLDAILVLALVVVGARGLSNGASQAAAVML